MKWPCGISEGNRALSTTRTLKPLRARRSAVAAPAHLPPTTIASNTLTSLPDKRNFIRHHLVLGREEADFPSGLSLGMAMFWWCFLQERSGARFNALIRAPTCLRNMGR